MRRFLIISSFIIFLLLPSQAQTGENLRFRGQASGWVNVNPNNDMPLWTGVRYIPQLNLDAPLNTDRKFDLELSANITGSSSIDLPDRFDIDGNIKPYRAWVRYSASQFELRLGLQKINFGSASMLRPLMWFDQVDPRDPLQLTDGVWGLLGRYYFLNNVNIWLWGLYGNRGPKTWEVGETAEKKPEFGGRFQMPVSRGEAAFSFHHRKADIGSIVFQFAQTGNSGSDLSADDLNNEENPVAGFERIPENRLGFDAKWDIEIGLWIETAWIHKRKSLGPATNQHLFTLGADYTFNIGNGLHIAAEQIMISMDRDAFQLDNRNNFTALSLSYPVGIFDNVNAIAYRDWTNGNLYSLVNWHRQYDRLGLYLMAFWNPETFRLPQQTEAAQMFAGRGFQVMLVFNH